MGEFTRAMFFLAMFHLLVSIAAQRKRFKPTWESLDTHVAPAWYDEAKFGIFMHWGLYSVPAYGGAWFVEKWAAGDAQVVDFMKKNYPPNFKYADFAPQFTAEFFDPNKFADLVQASGAKYYVVTSKHHEGFTLWRSNVSWNWNAVDAGPHRDLIQELADAFRNRTDVHFGMYFSLFEFFHPLFLYDQANNFTTRKYPEQVALPQMYDYVTKYKPEYIWSDGSWMAPPEYWTSREWLAWLYNDSPVRDSILVNDRWGIGVPCHHGDVRNCHDLFDPSTKPPFKWEDATILDKGGWAYRRGIKSSDVKTAEEVIELLIKTVSLGGNLLLNVGPTKDGRIIPIFEERLLQIGSWMKINGDGIYGTKSWRVYNDTAESITWYTTKGDYVYALVKEWPDDDIIELQAPIPTASTTVSMMGFPGPLPWQGKVGKPGMMIDVHTVFRKQPCQWAWVLQLEHVE